MGISLGSNLGDRMAHLRDARELLAAQPEIAIRTSSPVYETEPVDVAPEYQDLHFLNAVVIIDAHSSPHDVHKSLHDIETRLGRTRTADRNAPRPLDADMLYAGTLSIDEPDLRIPHPRWAARRFVLQPLADVRPALILPGQSRPVCDVLRTCPDTSAVNLFLQEW